MPEINVFDMNGQPASKVALPDAKFGVHVRDAVIHQAVVMYQANDRQGTVATKGRSQVSGGGKKPWRQKGTGRARAGSSRSPLWKKGGIIFGPQPRDFGYSVPKKVRLAALRESLNTKFLTNHLVCVDQLDVSSGKTKDFAKVLGALNLQGRTLVLLDSAIEKTALASRNLAHVRMVRAMDVNAADIMSMKNVLLTRKALEVLLKRIE
jgi:large subunit ribosomal protein L4